MTKQNSLSGRFRLDDMTHRFQTLLRMSSFTLALAALLLTARVAGAADASPETLPSPPEGSEVQLFIENDVLAGTDRYYTNGFKLGVGAPFPALRDFFEIPAKYSLDIFSDAQASHHFGLFLGQNIYTPRRISITAPQPYDLPWAAWLYLGGVAQRAKGNRLDTAELDIGVVGPPALGKEVQSNWHKLIGVAQPEGWGNQLPSELGFSAAYLQKRKYGNSHFEIVPHMGLTLGTVMTLARIGGTVRFGQNMTGFGPDTIEPGGAMLQNTRRDRDGAGRPRYEWSGFIGTDVRYVARNIFLDGTVFHQSASVDKHHIVRDITLGAAIRIDVIRISLTRVLRSEEFTTPLGGSGSQVFYSLNLGLEF
jgi:lipid A 3-O-deacylase